MSKSTGIDEGRRLLGGSCLCIGGAPALASITEEGELGNDRQGSAGLDQRAVHALALIREDAQVNDTPSKYDENTGDLRRSFSLAVAVGRGTPQKQLDVQIQPSRMVVFGDSDFVSNDALTGGDQDLFMSAMNWLLDRNELMAIAPKPIEEVKLNLTDKQLRNLFWINVVGIPLLAVAGGLLVWGRRRK